MHKMVVSPGFANNQICHDYIFHTQYLYSLISVNPAGFAFHMLIQINSRKYLFSISLNSFFGYNE